MGKETNKTGTTTAPKKKAVAKKKCGRKPQDIKKNPRAQLAFRLLLEGLPRKEIAARIGVTRNTVDSWFVKLGVEKAVDPSKRYNRAEETAKQKQLLQIKEEMEAAGDLDPRNLTIGPEDAPAFLSTANQAEASRQLAIEARKLETPAEQYQHYAANMGLLLMEKGMKNVRPPRTIAELDKLDQLIRRNVGLHPTNGGGENGGGGIQRLAIDVTILNTAPRKLSREQPKAQEVAVEVYDEHDRQQAAKDEEYGQGEDDN